MREGGGGKCMGKRLFECVEMGYVVDYWAQWSNDCEIPTVTALYCLMVACTTVKGYTCLLFIILIQWNLSIKDTPNTGHLSNEDTVSCPNHIELCTNLPLN